MNKISKIAVIAFFLSATLGAALSQAQEQGTVVRLDPALDGIIAPNAKLEQLVDTPGLGTREGPVWVRNGGYLIYCDRSGGVTPASNVALSANVVKWDPRTGKSSILMENAQCDGLTLDRQGRIAIAVNIGPGKIVRVEKDGKNSVLASDYNGKPINAPNELIYKSDGTLYFSDPPEFGNTSQTPSIYLLKGGKLTLLSPTNSTHIASPNGLALSPDEKHLYATDNPKIDNGI
jgi:gluconolactonase